MKNNFIKAAVLTGLVVVASGAMGNEYNSEFCFGGEYIHARGNDLCLPYFDPKNPVHTEPRHQGEIERNLSKKQISQIEQLFASWQRECNRKPDLFWEIRAGGCRNAKTGKIEKSEDF